tara:strand:+ start:2382 stop:2633 length:252 start_codon:yes stop_codon:yes gene_type:complete
MKPIVLQQAGAFITVNYPYRRTPDLYVAAKGYPVFCAQCEAKFDHDKILSHIRGHDKRKGEAIILHPENGKLYEVSEIKEVSL